MKYKLKYTVPQLNNCCLFSSVAHAVSNLRYPYFSYEQSWNGDNYSFQYGGSRGTVTFNRKNNLVVAAFRDDRSDKIREYPTFRASGLFCEADRRVQETANAVTLEYLYYDFGGITVPTATAAMWSEADVLYSPDEGEIFVANGGEFIDIICIPIEELAEYWREQYELTENEIKATELIFQIKRKGGNQIAFDDIPIAIDKNAEGYAEFLESLSEIDINSTRGRFSCVNTNEQV